MTIFTYITHDETGNTCLKLEVVPNPKISYRYLLACNRIQDPITLAAKIHGFSHAHPDDIKAILKDAGKQDTETARACDKVYESCPICASTGRPIQRKKTSLTHVNSAIN